jgi:hypothetical protein
MQTRLSLPSSDVETAFESLSSLRGMGESGRLTKDDRRNVVVAKDRVYETNLLLFWPDNIYAALMNRDIGGQDEGQAYLFDRLYLS